MIISERVRILCKSRDITVAKLERDLDFGNGTIRNWDKSSPSVDKVQKVADYFKIPVSQILGEPSRNNQAEDIIKVDPDLFITMCRAKELPEEMRKEIKNYAAYILEKHLNGKNEKK